MCTREYLDEHFFSLEKSEVSSVTPNLENTYCIDNPTRLDHVSNWGEAYSKSLGIRVSRCQGEGAGCKSEEEIAQFIDNIYLYVYYND